nr:MAG TPA: hypothetical protein [Bacteriophage sp.]
MSNSDTISFNFLQNFKFKKCLPKLIEILLKIIIGVLII